MRACAREAAYGWINMSRGDRCRKGKKKMCWMCWIRWIPIKVNRAGKRVTLGRSKICCRVSVESTRSFDSCLHISKAFDTVDAGIGPELPNLCLSCEPRGFFFPLSFFFFFFFSISFSPILLTMIWLMVFLFYFNILFPILFYPLIIFYT